LETCNVERGMGEMSDLIDEREKRIRARAKV
jgi:hypothetical protein